MPIWDDFEFNLNERFWAITAMITSVLGSIMVNRRTVHLEQRSWFLKSEQSNISPLMNTWFSQCQQWINLWQDVHTQNAPTLNLSNDYMHLKLSVTQAHYTCPVL